MPWAPTYIATKASSGTGARAGRVPFPISRSTPFVMRTTFDAGTPAATMPSRMPSVSATIRSARR